MFGRVAPPAGFAADLRLLERGEVIGLMQGAFDFSTPIERRVDALDDAEGRPHVALIGWCVDV